MVHKLHNLFYLQHVISTIVQIINYLGTWPWLIFEPKYIYEMYINFLINA